MVDFIEYAEDEASRYSVAERFVGWLETRIVEDARGDNLGVSDVDPTGRFWLGRLGPKDVVTRADERADRLEPCAIGLRLRPCVSEGPWQVNARVKWSLWKREKSGGGDQRYRWTKTTPFECEVPLDVPDRLGDHIFAGDEILAKFAEAGAVGLAGEVRVKVTGRVPGQRALEVTFVNTSVEVDAFCDGRFFECSLAVDGLDRVPFELEALPDSFRFDRDVEAFGLNCGAEVNGTIVRTTDAPAKTRLRPDYWAVSSEKPDFTFSTLAADPVPTCQALLTAFELWSDENWSDKVLSARANAEGWSAGMRDEARDAATEFAVELGRVRQGVQILQENKNLRVAFAAMNDAMFLSARGRYDSWRPFQLAFLLANLGCLVDADNDCSVVDIVWFATGGGKTETYLGLLITAALLDRMRGKLSGVTAWSRFPLRLLSLQQTQRFANALSAAEVVRQRLNLPGDPFSLGFLVGGGATPNRIKKESQRANEDASKIEDMTNPYLLLDECPFCRSREVMTKFDRATWRLVHLCKAAECFSNGQPLPIHVIDDDVWRFLPTVVVGTLDKAANLARQSGMRCMVGAPWGLCAKPGHGYTYSARRDFPNGCLVPGCKGEAGPLPIAADLYAPTFRLQDELHLLRDSLGAVDAHYEAALDDIQQELSGRRPKILASSATLAGYEKQIDVLYRRSGRVFPQPAPREGSGFWTADSSQVMRRYIALAPRRLTVEFVVDRLVVTLQLAIRELLADPAPLCEELGIDNRYSDFLADLYGTNVVYGNTLQDIDAVLRSAETQYANVEPPPNIGSLTGRTAFEEVRTTLERLQHPEKPFADRLHLIAASSMMSHGVDIDRLNIMVMLAFPLGVAEFIQATARVGRRWPGLVIVVPKMTRERDASVYRAFPEFVSHGDRFVEPIPITRKSRRVLERTIAGLELSRMVQVHEPASKARLSTIGDLGKLVRANADLLSDDRIAVGRSLGLGPDDEFMNDQLDIWFEGFARNLRQPRADATFLSHLSPTGDPMFSLRDVEEQAPVSGNSSR